MPTDHDIPKLIINKVPTKAQYDQMVKNADELYLIPDDSQGLPDQTGQSGKYLKTDGTDASWASVPAGTVTSVRVQAGTGLASSQSTAQSTTLNTTISIASGYKLPTTTEWGNKQDVISDLSTIRDGASAGATAVQPGDLATVATTGAYSDLSGTPSLSTVAISGSYNDLSNKPTIPTVNDAVLTIQKNGATVSTFTANSATNAVANITVPTKVSDLTNDSGYITGITAKNVTTALGYTPYDSTNPSGYISGITANNVTVALGYTPYNSTNPNGYTSNTGTVKSVQVQAGTGLTSSTSTAQNTTLNTTISIASGYKLPTTTEWSGKQDALTTQTAYTSKGSATKVPQITTNTLGQVTGITEVTITQPTVNNSTITIQKNSTTVDSFTLNQSSGKTINISVPTKVSDLSNDSGFITDITANNVTTALGYTPYNSTNPNGYISGINANNVTTALGYTPYNSTNPNGYITSADIPTIKNLNTNNTTGQTASASESLTGTGTVNLHKVSKTGSYNDLLNKPTIPTVNNATLTIQKNGTTVSSFSANASSNVTCNITVPTKLSEFTDDLGSDPTHTHSQYLTSHQNIKVLKTDNTAAQSTSAGEAIAGNGTISLHKIAKTGTFGDLLSKPTSISGYGITDAYTKTEVDGMISSVYKPAGSVAFASLPTLASGVLGNVYNVTDAFTTTNDFVEGSGKNYPAGTNVVVVNTGTSSNPTYKFDVLSGFVDLSGYVPTSRKVNNKSLSADITLTASDVGALPDNTTIPQGTVTSVRVQAGTGLVSSVSTAQTTSLNTTISIASGYKLPTTTEWGNKQDALTTQTAYTSKGSATKVPQITTNTLGQVTGITEVDITQPTVNNSSVTIQKNNTTVSTFTLNQSTSTTVNISVPTKTSDLTNDSGFLTAHQSIKTLNTTNTSTLTTSASEDIKGSGTLNLHKVSKTGSYNDLLNKPTIPTVNNNTITIQKNSTTVDSFTLNQNSNKTIDISVPTTVAELSDASNYVQTSSLEEAATVAKTGDYNDLINKPTIPTVNNAVLTIQKNSATISTFSANASANVTCNIAVPTKVSELTNDSGYTTNTGTVTSVRVQAGTGLSSSTSTAQNTTLNTTISIASGYKLPTTTEWSNKQDALPSQSGNSGKYLTTNGSALSWASVDALPSQSGQSGKFLTTNGTSASWAAPATWTYNAATKTMEVD